MDSPYNKPAPYVVIKSAKGEAKVREGEKGSATGVSFINHAPIYYVKGKFYGGSNVITK